MLQFCSVSNSLTHTTLSIKREIYFSKELCRSSLLCRRYDSAYRCICIMWLYNTSTPIIYCTRQVLQTAYSVCTEIMQKSSSHKRSSLMSSSFLLRQCTACLVRLDFEILFTNRSARAGYDTRSIFKRSLTGLNSEFSFS